MCYLLGEPNFEHNFLIYKEGSFTKEVFWLFWWKFNWVFPSCMQPLTFLICCSASKVLCDLHADEQNFFWSPHWSKFSSSECFDHLGCFVKRHYPLLRHAPISLKVLCRCAAVLSVTVLWKLTLHFAGRVAFKIHLYWM